MKTFVILNTDELGIVDFTQVAEISAEYCRYSVDGTKTFVKYIGEQPSFLSGKTEYTHSEILTILDQTGTAYTIVASDAGKVITCNNGSAVTVTVPASLGAGFTCSVVQKGAGQVTFSASSTTINNRQSHTKIAGQHGVATLVSTASDVFVLAGDTAS